MIGGMIGSPVSFLSPSDLNYAAKIANPVFNAVPYVPSNNMHPADPNYNAKMVQQAPPILQAPVRPTFQIDPNQVINDIAMGAFWGEPTTPPQMNAFSMYGSQAPAFDWSGFFNRFGGK